MANGLAGRIGHFSYFSRFKIPQLFQGLWGVGIINLEIESADSGFFVQLIILRDFSLLGSDSHHHSLEIHESQNEWILKKTRQQGIEAKNRRHIPSYVAIAMAKPSLACHIGTNVATMTHNTSERV